MLVFIHKRFVLIFSDHIDSMLSLNTGTCCMYDEMKIFSLLTAIFPLNSFLLLYMLDERSIMLCHLCYTIPLMKVINPGG